MKENAVLRISRLCMLFTFLAFLLATPLMLGGVLGFFVLQDHPLSPLATTLLMVGAVIYASGLFSFIASIILGVQKKAELVPAD